MHVDIYSLFAAAAAATSDDTNNDDDIGGYGDTEKEFWDASSTVVRPLHSAQKCSRLARATALHFCTSTVASRTTTRRRRAW